MTLTLLKAIFLGLVAFLATTEGGLTSTVYKNFALSNGKTFNYYISYNATIPASSYKHLVLVVHGQPRDVRSTMAGPIETRFAAEKTTGALIVGPLFQVAADANANCNADSRPIPPATANDATWTCSSWMQGRESTNNGPSSFVALNNLLSKLKQDFPSLSTASLVGFSAGGQFMQRYIAFSKIPSGVTAKFLVASPSSYLYFDSVRPSPVGKDWSACTTNDACSFSFATPTNCATSNQWKYGLDARPASVAGEAATLRSNYVSANIIYVAGSQDTGSADDGCAAVVQGSGRLQRALAYAAYDRKYLATSKNRKVVTPDCGHDVYCVTKSTSVSQVYLA
ncbi:hypothetical protein Poli38472_007841 [Pythium oligandrum]|uniref:Uncharacterized protein n=1 Tax=Pythium oligandrum TaxID=41045 RepID=A0A8K1CRB6_PYTOL|nr:hypothetical protein Poli38472_007841 [Pythium oligandrum]|eukprot:TMW68169.1 hypothetical protein Poli38472_007841 [Pythium oligandrum]